jgi:hypothetical protein
MTRCRTRAWAAHFTTVVSVATALVYTRLPARADGIEIRDFAIRIKNKPAGQYRMSITTKNDTVTVTGQAQVNFRQFGFRYSYWYSGTETWQNGRLVQLDSSCNDDGKQYAVSARAGDGGLQVQGNGQIRNTRADVWTTTYWHLAEPRFHNQNVPLLDADTGREMAAYLSFVGREIVAVGGQQQACAHYKLTGANIQVDLWYDAQDRLVREVSVEQGQPTLLELQRIERK